MENLRELWTNSADSEWDIRVMGTSPVTDRVEIEKGDVLQIYFFISFPLFYLSYLSSIQKKRGGPRSCIDATSVEASNMIVH